MVRPTTDPKLRMGEEIRIPLTTQQKEAIRRTASANGLGMAAWIRLVALTAAEPRKSTLLQRQSNPPIGDDS